MAAQLLYWRADLPLPKSRLGAHFMNFEIVGIVMSSIFVSLQDLAATASEPLAIFLWGIALVLASCRRASPSTPEQASTAVRQARVQAAPIDYAATQSLEAESLALRPRLH